MRKISQRALYGIYGAIFGLAFPVIAMVVTFVEFGLRWDFPHGIALAHELQPLLWIIDSAPLFLGLFAALAGHRQDKVIGIVTSLEHTVEETLDRFRIAVEAAPSGIMMVDEKGQIVLANSQMEAMFHFSSGDLVGLAVEKLLPNDLRDGHAKLVASFFSNPEQRQMGEGRDLLARRQDGSQFPVEVRLNPIKTHEGAFALATLVDITDRKETEEATKAARKIAEEASRAKSEFLANMSHELRTPLNSIIGFSKLLLKNKKGHLDPKEISFGERIQDNGIHLLELINEILDLSKIESGKIELNLAPTSMNALIRTTVEELAGNAAARGIGLRYTAFDIDAPITADRTRLKQILINLIGNGLKFTHEGHVEVRAVSDPKTSQPVAIEVIDTGVGIPVEKQRLVFEPFRQVDASTSRTYGGTGLGLAIARQLCLAMSFDLSLESEIGTGTTFRIDFGQAARSPTPPPVDALLAPSLTEGSSLALIIDNDPDARLLTERAFDDLGWRTITAADGEMGLKLAQEHHPDLISVDLLTPDMSGWEVIRLLREHEDLQRTPAIVVSSAGDGAAFSVARDIDVLTKPVKSSDLSQVLARFSSPELATILIVDDDKDARALLREQVADIAARVFEAPDGLAGLAILEKERPDLVLLDLMMPHIDGFEFVRRVRANEEWKNTPIVVVSAKELSVGERETLARTTSSVHEKGAWVQSSLMASLEELGFGAQQT